MADRMADRRAEMSDKEKLVFWWVDDNLKPHTEFIGMHPLVSTSTDHIVLVIKDITANEFGN